MRQHSGHTHRHAYNVCPWKGDEGKTLTCMLHKHTKARGAASKGGKAQGP